MFVYSSRFIIFRYVYPRHWDFMTLIQKAIPDYTWYWPMSLRQNSSSPEQNGRHFADIFKFIFMNEKFCISIRAI